MIRGLTLTMVNFNLILIANSEPTLSNVDDSKENLNGDENLVERTQGKSDPMQCKLSVNMILPELTECV